MEERLGNFENKPELRGSCEKIKLFEVIVRNSFLKNYFSEIFDILYIKSRVIIKGD